MYWRSPESGDVWHRLWHLKNYSDPALRADGGDAALPQRLRVDWAIVPRTQQNEKPPKTRFDCKKNTHIQARRGALIVYPTGIHVKQYNFPAGNTLVITPTLHGPLNILLWSLSDLITGQLSRKTPKRAICHVRCPDIRERDVTGIF